MIGQLGGYSRLVLRGGIGEQPRGLYPTLWCPFSPRRASPGAALAPRGRCRGARRGRRSPVEPRSAARHRGGVGNEDVPGGEGGDRWAK